MTLTDIDIDEYLRQLDWINHDMPAPMDRLAVGAIDAISHMVDGTANRADLLAFQAWVTNRRLAGDSEEDLASSMAVVNDLARKLGTA